MTIFLSIVFILALLVLGVVLLVRLKRASLVRGWSFEAEPSGHGYRVEVTDPDGSTWGHTTYSGQKPEKNGNRASYNHANYWDIGSPKQISGIVVKCAAKKREQDRLAERQKVAGTF